MKLLLVGLLLFTQASFAGVPCEDWLGTASRQYTALARERMLIGQLDPRLKARRLILPKGGLCAPTCGVNVLHAMLKLAGHDVKGYQFAADRRIQDIVEAIWRRFRQDARMGIGLHRLAPALDDLGEYLGLEIESEIVPAGTRGYTTSDLVTAPNELLIISVLSGWRGSERLAHALVAMDADPGGSRITISNPMRPSHITRVEMKDVVGLYDIPTVRFNLGLGKDPYDDTLNSVLRVRLREARR